MSHALAQLGAGVGVSAQTREQAAAMYDTVDVDAILAVLEYHTPVHVAGAVLYVAACATDAPVTFEELAAVVVAESLLDRDTAESSVEVRLSQAHSALTDHYSVATLYVDAICDQLDLPPGLQADVRDLVEQFTRDSRPAAGAVVYEAALEQGAGVTQRTVADAGNTTRASIRYVRQHEPVPTASNPS